MQEYTSAPMEPDYQKAKRIWRREFSRIGWAMFAMMLLSSVSILSIYFLAAWIDRDLLESAWVTIGANVVGYYGVGFPVFYLIIRGCRTHDLPGRITGDLTPWRLLRLLVVCFGVSYLGNLASLWLTDLIGRLKGSPVDNPVEGIMEMAAGQSLLPTFLYLVCIAPVMEELVFRKIILERTRKHGDRFCMAFNGMAFALFHANLSQMIYAFLLGAIFSYIVLKTGQVAYTMILHACINFVGFSGMAGLLTENEAFIGAMGVVMGLFVLFCMIAAPVMLVRSRRRIFFQQSPVSANMPGRAGMVLLNPGMVVFLVLMTVLIVLNTLL